MTGRTSDPRAPLWSRTGGPIQIDSSDPTPGVNWLRHYSPPWRRKRIEPTSPSLRLSRPLKGNDVARSGQSQSEPTKRDHIAPVQAGSTGHPAARTWLRGRRLDRWIVQSIQQVLRVSWVLSVSTAPRRTRLTIEQRYAGHSGQPGHQQPTGRAGAPISFLSTPRPSHGALSLVLRHSARLNFDSRGTVDQHGRLAAPTRHPEIGRTRVARPFMPR